MQTVCLVGKPNVGKSSIFNRLIKENKSIIMDTPGVTRDRIYGRVNHNDKSFYLIDTGGISLGEDDFAKDILVQATLAIDEADLVLFVVDGNDDPDASDKKVAEILHKSSKKVIVVVNKIDNDKKKENLYNYYELGFSDLVAVSASHNIGFDGLLNTITSDLPEEVKEEDTSLKFCIIGRPNVGKSSLINEKVDAIVIDDARLDILKEENNEEYNLLKKIGSYSIDVKSEKIGKEVDVTNSSFNIYVSGIDTYGSINKVSRSDVNILITVNPVTKEILLTNIPRDYYVKLHKNGEYDKLTHAGIYGIDESINTLEDLFDTKINYYVKVNFTSLVDIVDALDGITVNSPYSFVSQDGYSYKKGDNILDGKKALSFARERKSFKEGDRTRGENQQRVLTALINKAMSPKIITNYTNLLTSLKGKFVTNISDEDITKLIKMQLKNNSSWTIKSISVNGTDAMDYVYSYNKTKLYVMKPDYETVNNAKEQIKKVQDKKG